MPYGFVPVRVPGGHPTPNSMSDYRIADDYNTNIIRGDVVAQHTDGTLIRSTASLLMVGVFWGVEYQSSVTGEVIFDSQWPASQSIAAGTIAKAYVYDDPNTVFKAEADQDSTALAQTDVGALVDITTTAGNTTVKRSGMGIDSSTVGTGSGGNFKLLNSAELEQAYPAASTVMDVYVLANEHRNKAAVDGI